MTLQERQVELEKTQRKEDVSLARLERSIELLAVDVRELGRKQQKTLDRVNRIERALNG